MKTRADLTRRVAQTLNILAAGQDLAPEDAQRIDEQIEGVLRRLGRRGIYYTGNFQSFEDEALDPLAVQIAWTIASEFGVQMALEQAVMSETELRAIQAVPHTLGRANIQYF